ncbi:MAG TPA: sigma-70 family RNA polymerase sigma factor [Gemmatimonadaceae bacterium]|nr:sigma-70 family RNA polymerase sigma factor [Gemmatimonadaceae bacterium]
MADWTDELRNGSPGRAWDDFIKRYRALVFATIQHYARDYDDVMDVFARVCEALRADDMRRVRSYLDQPEHTARFTTWLVAVVRNITIDWFRSRDGRRRLSTIADDMPTLRKQIFNAVFIQRRSHVEAYELISALSPKPLAFREFLAELRETYRAASAGRRGTILRDLAPPDLAPDELDSADPAESDERTRRVEEALRTLPPQDRAAVELYVLEDLSAAEIARVLGLRNAKAAYNRIYRALDVLRRHMAALGLTRSDL